MTQNWSIVGYLHDPTINVDRIMVETSGSLDEMPSLRLSGPDLSPTTFLAVEPISPTEITEPHRTHPPITETGCFLDNHRGHYITRDMIGFAVDLGYNIGECEQFALDQYEDHNHEESYPHESITDLAESALQWLNTPENVGPHTGIGARPHPYQNTAPIIPEGFAWDWNDGDFGLYEIESGDSGGIDEDSSDDAGMEAAPMSSEYELNPAREDGCG